MCEFVRCASECVFVFLFGMVMRAASVCVCVCFCVCMPWHVFFLCGWHCALCDCGRCPWSLVSTPVRGFTVNLAAHFRGGLVVAS